MFQSDVVGLHRPDEISLAVEEHVAVADGPQQASEAARPNQRDKEVALVFVEAADNGRELGAVALQPGAHLLVERNDGGNAGIELGYLFFSVENLLAKGDQAQLRLVQRLLQHQRVGLRGRQVADQLTLGLAVLQRRDGRRRTGRWRRRWGCGQRGAEAARRDPGIRAGRRRR